MGKGFEADNAAVVSVAQAVCLHKLRAAMRDAHNLLVLQNATQSQSQSTPEDCLPANRTDSVGQTPSQSGLQASNSEGEIGTKTESEEQLEIILLEYGEFLASSNHADAVDVLRVFLLELLNSQSELRAELASWRIEAASTPLDPLQVCVCLCA